LRLLVVSHVFWPETFRINDLVAEMVARGHEVTVLTGAPNYPEGRIFPEFKRDPARFTEYRGARIVRVPIVPRGQSRLLLVLNYLSFVVSGALVGAWKLRGQKFDAIFVWESSPVTVGLPAAVLRWLKKAPIAFWVLDLWPDTLQALGILRSPFLLGAVGRLVAFIYARCDLILAQSRSFIPQIARYCPDAGKIVYFPSWAESIFQSGALEPAPEVPARSGSFDIMFAGNIGEAQDFPAILDAAERLKGHPRIRWLFVGDGSVAGWVRAEIVRRGLQEHVLMLGRHPLERMPSFYQHADALLVALKDEPIFAMTIPGKLQSYLAAGIPVVAMLNGEGADVVRQSLAGVTCKASDAQGLADAILQLSMSSSEELAAMGRNAKTFSNREFDRQTLITRLEGWLKQLRAGVHGNLIQPR
jgi:colanic acid biosynthesis glycosyl transferase WcaI